MTTLLQDSPKVTLPEPLTSDVVALATIAAVFLGPLPNQHGDSMALQNADALLLASRDYLIKVQQEDEQSVKGVERLHLSWTESNDKSRYGR